MNDELDDFWCIIDEFRVEPWGNAIVSELVKDSSSNFDDNEVTQEMVYTFQLWLLNEDARDSI